MGTGIGEEETKGCDVSLIDGTSKMLGVEVGTCMGAKETEGTVIIGLIEGTSKVLGATLVVFFGAVSLYLDLGLDLFLCDHTFLCAA